MNRIIQESSFSCSNPVNPDQGLYLQKVHTHAIRGFNVHSNRLRYEGAQYLGNGFQEVIYQRCLAIELENAKVPFEREVEQAIYYNGIRVGTRRADFVVAEKITVELKAVIHLEDVHLAQAKNYVVAYHFPIGLLINFGAASLQYKKVFNPKYRLYPETKTP